jgi:branched-chain amino acid transport system ATP-binding protein
MSAPLLEAVEASFGYAGRPAVDKLNLHIQPGEIVALLGPNGAGKTTTVLGLAGGARILGGTVKWKGDPTRARLDERVRGGISLVREGRTVIKALSVADNLKLVAPIKRCLELFPELEPHLRRRAGVLSGGQQQMLALARALAREPELLMVDELSLGLAPVIVHRLFESLAAARGQGTAVLVVEQQVRQALAIADRGYVLRRGRVHLEGSAQELRAKQASIEGAYLSTASSVGAEGERLPIRQQSPRRAATEE